MRHLWGESLHTSQAALGFDFQFKDVALNNLLTVEVVLENPAAPLIKTIIWSLLIQATLVS